MKKSTTACEGSPIVPGRWQKTATKKLENKAAIFQFLISSFWFASRSHGAVFSSPRARGYAKFSGHVGAST
jgi:hypothetical protein